MSSGSGSKDDSKPAFSVVIPLYNKEKEVKRAVDSVLSQTIKDIEIIIVNDGSTDDGPGIVQGIDDRRIKIIHQDNEGAAAARNRGIFAARGDVLAFLDADDEWHADFLETIFRLSATYAECDVFATAYRVQEIGGRWRKPRIRGIPRSWSEGILKNYFEVSSKSDPLFCSSSVALAKKAIISIGRFPMGVTTGEDLLTWARLAERYAIAYTTRPLAVFHRDHYRFDSVVPRYPDPHDYVGKELIKIMKNTQSRGAKDYVGRWYQMRAAKYLELGLPQKAWPEMARTVRFRGFSLRMIPMCFISLIPEKLSQFLFLRLRSLIR